MRRRPIGVRPRRGPGLLGTMARTAVIAGTATAVSRGMSGAMSASAQQRADLEDYRAQQAAAFQQAQIDAAVQQHMSAQQADMAPADDLMAQLQQLAQMKQGGLLTEDEFVAAKAKLLTS